MKNENTSKKRFSFGGCFWIWLTMVVCLVGLGLVFNWGIWRSLSYELTGLEFPLVKIYGTDTSKRGRELGFWVEVYQLPDNLQHNLKEQKIDFKKYPMFSGLELDKYKRITWHSGFPRNDIEKKIYDFFKKDVSKIKILDGESVSNIEDAKDLANHLLQYSDTLCGGWYKGGECEGGVLIYNYFFYIINIKKRILIKFGLDT